MTARNLLITMLLGGIWHGANWTFVTWGALHGVGLALERLGTMKSRSILKSIWSPIVTFHFVVLTWIFFRAESNVEALNFIRTMLTWSRTGIDCDPTMVSLTFGALAIHLLPSNFRDSVTTYLSKLPVELQALTVATAVMAIVAIAPAETPPFIYFKF
jgi:D-alanyl-lipoteichoic acid acyltransferase DltB (MBOAT superfamily)